MTIQSQTSRVLFDGYNVATTNFVYNGNGSTSATAGWVSVRNDSIFVQSCVATKVRSGNIVQRIEGRFVGYDRSASIDIKTISSSESIDRIINITPNLEEIRIGVKSTVVPASLSASPVSYYAGVCKTDIK